MMPEHTPQQYDQVFQAYRREAFDMTEDGLLTRLAETRQNFITASLSDPPKNQFEFTVRDMYNVFFYELFRKAGMQAISAVRQGGDLAREVERPYLNNIALAHEDQPVTVDHVAHKISEQINPETPVLLGIWGFSDDGVARVAPTAYLLNNGSVVHVNRGPDTEGIPTFTYVPVNLSAGNEVIAGLMYNAHQEEAQRMKQIASVLKLRDPINIWDYAYKAAITPFITENMGTDEQHVAQATYNLYRHFLNSGEDEPIDAIVEGNSTALHHVRHALWQYAADNNLSPFLRANASIQVKRMIQFLRNLT
jgi:hypothetical protein